MNLSNVFSSLDSKYQEARFYIAKNLIDNGWEPIPIFSAEKKSFIKDWQVASGEDVTLERVITQMIQHRDHTSIGLLTRKLRCFDLDLQNEVHNQVLRVLIEDRCGPTPLLRRGSKGMMMCYRLVGEARGKITIKRGPTLVEPKRKTLVEIFGNGNQFVAYGIHPQTERPYQWLVAGQEPLTVPMNQLPGIDLDTLMLVKDDIVEALKEMGYQIETSASNGSHDTAAPLPDRKPIDTGLDVTQMFIDIINGHDARRRPSGYIDLKTCPSCGHDDYKSGLHVLADGGFDYHCHHSGCVYNRTTGWRPNGVVGQRVKHLYELLGGDKADFIYDLSKKFKADISDMIDLIKQNQTGAMIIK